ncbi:helix-turn-helix domain-containing protein [Streptomyces sp. bgisy027]|uniref:helix-turn-helix domain-containing protein n=1 Tax=Streptomyces sp. bgisy027 TaxID=3413770 RepID=UPI003D75C8D7
MKNSKRDAGEPSPDFKQWLHDQLTAHGFDLSGPRSGGRSRFAERSGISPSTVGRLLDGKRVTDMDVFTRLAEAISVPLGEVLVRAGILTEDQLAGVRSPETGPRRITPQQAAEELGIEDEQKRALFVAITETLQRQPPPGTGEGNLAEH